MDLGIAHGVQALAARLMWICRGLSVNCPGRSRRQAPNMPVICRDTRNIDVVTKGSIGAAAGKDANEAAGCIDEYRRGARSANFSRNAAMSLPAAATAPESRHLVRFPEASRIGLEYAEADLAMAVQIFYCTAGPTTYTSMSMLPGYWARQATG